LRGLAVAAEKRNSAIPDVPTLGEMGFPNVYSGSWVAVFAPAKTPDAVVQRLNAEINAGMKDKDALERLAKAGFDRAKSPAGTDAASKRGREGPGQDGQRQIGFE
jgi:tripartite-type tricarboxylate transporter receptor subunit TctC